MPIYIDPDTRIDYVLEAERGLDDATVFHYQPLTGREKLRMSLLGDDPLKLFEAALEKVVGWTNLRTQTGTQVDFAPDRLWNLPGDDLAELAAAIIETSRVSPRDAKN